MRTTLFTAMVAATLLALAGPVAAEADNIFGYNKITVPKDADAIVSVPFVNKSEGQFTVAGTASPSITVGESLSAGSYDSGLYYVRFTTGNAKGFWSTISSNPAGQLVLEDDSFFAKIGDGDEFKVYKHQTLAQVFPAALEGKAMVESDKDPVLPIFTFKTQVLVFDGAATGQDKAATTTYYYYDGAWRQSGQPFTISKDDAILRPDSYFIIRNENHDSDLLFLARGTVLQAPIGRELASGIENDVLTSTGRPVETTLAELALGGTPAFVDSTKDPVLPIFTFGDQLLVFDNTGAGFNRAASATYFYWNGAWRKSGQDFDKSFNTDTIAPSQGFILRKGSLGSGTNVWVTTPSF